MRRWQASISERLRTTGCRPAKEPSTLESSQRRLITEAQGRRLTRESNDEGPGPVSTEHRQRTGSAQRSSGQQQTRRWHPQRQDRPRHRLSGGCDGVHVPMGINVPVPHQRTEEKARWPALQHEARQARPNRQRHGSQGPGSDRPSLVSARAGGRVQLSPLTLAKPFRRSEQNWPGRPRGWSRCRPRCGPGR